MKTEIIELSKIQPNPNNPRKIDINSLNKLKQSIKDFPEMLNIRPLVIDNDNIVLGGNMRLRALQELGYKEVRVIYVDNLTEEQKKEFIIKDNMSYGDWDWNLINLEWDIQELSDWGLEIVNFVEEELEYDDLIDNNKKRPPFIKITLDTIDNLQAAEIDIRELIDRKYPKAFYSIGGGDV